MLLFMSTLMVCIASGFIPLINAELYLIGVGLYESGHHYLLLATAAAIGQTIAKGIVFFISKHTQYFMSEKYTTKLKKLELMQKRWSKASLSVLFCSSSLGFPPLLLTSVYYGLVNLNFYQFITITLIGRWIRFAVILMVPGALYWLRHFFN